MDKNEFYKVVLSLRNYVKKYKKVVDNNERKKMVIKIEEINRVIDSELDSYFQTTLNF